MDAYAELEVFDEDEGRVPFSSLWSEDPALLVFVRHFG